MGRLAPNAASLSHQMNGTTDLQTCMLSMTNPVVPNMSELPTTDTTAWPALKHTTKKNSRVQLVLRLFTRHEMMNKKSLIPPQSLTSSMLKNSFHLNLVL
jgi:hypothetical protein